MADNAYDIHQEVEAILSSASDSGSFPYFVEWHVWNEYYRSRRMSLLHNVSGNRSRGNFTVCGVPIPAENNLIPTTRRIKEVMRCKRCVRRIEKDREGR